MVRQKLQKTTCCIWTKRNKKQAKILIAILFLNHYNREYTSKMRYFFGLKEFTLREKNWGR